ncbi:hypothetical protein CsatA_028282 [Cannabis sativa]
MSAAQEGVLGRSKAEWTPSRDACLVQLFIEQHNCGRTAYNEFKNEVIRSVTRDFNKKFSMNLEENQIKNRYNVMKKDYGVVKTLLSHTGFSWDEIRKMVVADDKVWDNYIAIKSEARPFRRKSFPLYNQMAIIFEGDLNFTYWFYSIFQVGFISLTYSKAGESRSVMKHQFPSGLLVTAEEGNSNTETVRSSEPTNLPAQVVDGTPDSDSMIRIDDNDNDDDDNNRQQMKLKSEAPSMCGHKRRKCYKVRETIENTLYEMFCSANLKAAQRKAFSEKTLYQKCLEELQGIEELDDMEFTKAVNVLKDDKNAVAFMTIKGPRRLIWLRSQWPAS